MAGVAEWIELFAEQIEDLGNAEINEGLPLRRISKEHDKQ
jgi:hypothetical protein